MKYSVIVPVFNAEKSLERCINSIISQKSEVIELELIIVDNASTDRSLQIARALEKQYDDITVLSAKEKGVSNARNTGLKHVTGEIVAFCDSDDYWDNNVLRIAEREFKNDKIDAISFGICDVIDNETIVRRKCKKEISDLYGEHAVEALIFDGDIMGSVCNKLYRANLIAENCFPTDITHCEDMYFNVEVFLKNSKAILRVLDSVGYYYVQSIGSATNSFERVYDTNGVNNYIKTANRMLEDFDFSTRMVHIINGNKGRYAVCELRKASMMDGAYTELQLSLLKQELRAHFWETILFCSYFGKKIKIKWIIWIMKYHLL